jgi:hypothetical protein
VERDDLIKEILLDLHKDMGIVKSEVSAIKVDLKEHMRRTALLEASLEKVKIDVTLAKGAIGLLGVLATIVSVLKYTGKF